MTLKHEYAKLERDCKNNTEIYIVLLVLPCLFVFKLGFKLAYSLLAIHRKVLSAMHAKLMKSVNCRADLCCEKYQ